MILGQTSFIVIPSMNESILIFLLTFIILISLLSKTQRHLLGPLDYLQLMYFLTSFFSKNSAISLTTIQNLSCDLLCSILPRDVGLRYKLGGLLVPLSIC